MQGVNWLRKDFTKGSFPWNLRNFSQQLLSRATFGECFCFESPIKFVSPFGFTKTNKHSLQVVRVTFSNCFPERRWNIRSWWSLITIKTQVKVTEARFRHFSLTLSTFSEKPFCRRYTNTFFWVLAVFLVWEGNFAV